MKVLVTGAAGFLGLNIVEALNEHGYNPIAFARKSSRLDFLEAQKCPVRFGDILDASSLDKACEGVDYVIHCAGNTSGFRVHRKLQREINVAGTANVIESCLRHGIKRLVYTSSTSTIGTNGDGLPSDEKVPLNGFRARSQYGRSKIQAEDLVSEASQRGLSAIILNPAEVMGAYDYHFGWGSVILGLKRKSLPIIPLGGGSFCHAKEVGRAHVAALTKGRDGHRYILAGTDVSYSQFFRSVADLTGSELPRPSSFMNRAAVIGPVFAFQELLGFLTKKLPSLDQNRIKVFYTNIYFDGRKACSELDFKVRSIDEMILDSFHWYQANGFL